MTTDTTTPHEWVAHGWRWVWITAAGFIRSPFADLPEEHTIVPPNGVMEMKCKSGHTTPNLECGCGIYWAPTVRSIFHYGRKDDKRTLAICRGRVTDIHDASRPRRRGREYRSTAFIVDGVYGVNPEGIELSKLAAERYSIRGGELAEYIALSGELDLQYEQKGDVNQREFAAQYGIRPSGIDISNWKRVGPQAGSNPGGVFAAENGDRWYLKALATPDHVNSELAASKLYELAGARIPQVAASADGTTFLSKIEDGRTYAELPQSGRAAARKLARRDFVTDAWLANWDAPCEGNIRFNSDGEAIRVDVGGALRYRARGESKGAAFGQIVGELQTMRDPGMSPRGSIIYANLTISEARANVRRILAIRPDEIAATADEHYLPESTVQILIDRRAYLADQYGLQIPEATSAEDAA